MNWTFRKNITAQKIRGSNVRNFGLKTLIARPIKISKEKFIANIAKVSVFGKLSNDTILTKMYIVIHKILAFEVLTSTAQNCAHCANFKK